MVILVTGGSGLVGNGIRLAIESTIDFKKDDFIFISSKDCDLRDEDETMKFFHLIKPTKVIHLAAKTENMKINMNVLKAAHEIGVRDMLCCLSTCIFPCSITYPIKESQLQDGPPHESNFGYSYSKRMLKVLCDAYNKKYATNFKCFIPTNVFGPFDNFKLQEAHVIPALIHKSMLNKELYVLGSGCAMRQFIFSIDLGMLILLLFNNYNESEPIILSVPENDEISIRDISNIIANFFNIESIHFDSKYSDGQLKKTVDTSKLSKFFPGFKFTPIEEALKMTCEWLENNKKTARIYQLFFRYN